MLRPETPPTPLLPSLDLPDDQEQRRTVLRAYAEALETRGLYEDAGLAFVTAGLTHEALAAYRGGLHWRPALTLAGG